MRKVTLSRASRPLAQYAVELKDEIMVVTKGRHAVAALVPLKNVDRESLALSTHPEFMKLVRRARAEFRAGKTVSLEEMHTRVRVTRSPNRRLQSTAPKRRGG
jgi:PHD/YefM family antitoxin component YafN of YafNO toxin-antitoxin module